MCIDGRLRRVRSWRRAALQASAFVVMIAGCSSLADQVDVSAQARAGGAPTTIEDPCRFATAEAVGKAFGRRMQSSKLVDVCQYRGTPTDLVVVRVKARPEGTILQHVKSAAAQGRKGRRRQRQRSAKPTSTVFLPRSSVVSATTTCTSRRPSSRAS